MPRVQRPPHAEQLPVRAFFCYTTRSGGLECLQARVEWQAGRPPQGFGGWGVDWSGTVGALHNLQLAPPCTLEPWRGVAQPIACMKTEHETLVSNTAASLRPTVAAPSGSVCWAGNGY